MLILEKEDYNKIVLDIENKRVTEELKNLRRFSIFSYLTRQTLHKMYYQMNVKKYLRGQTVFAEDNELNNIYFIKSGQFEQTKGVRFGYEKDGTLSILSEPIVKFDSDKEIMIKE